MAHPGEGKTSIQFVLSDDAHAALKKAAQQVSESEGKQVFVSDIIRRALAGYLNELGITADFSVDRGGWRGGSKDEESE